MRKEVILGIIIYTLIIGTGIVYYSFPDAGLKIRIDEDQTTFYIKMGFYRVVAREIGSMWDFPSKMNRDLSQLTRETLVDESTNTSQEIRTTVYQRGPVVKDTYNFDGNLNDIEMHPKDHIIEIFNGSGYVYQYEVRDLWYYNGETEDVSSPIQTGRIKIEWQDGAYFSKIYKSKLLKVRYKIESDYVRIEARVFDPASTTYLYFLDSDGNAYTAPIDIEDESTITIKGNVTPSNLEVCISADHPDIGTNVSCATRSVEYNWTVISGSNTFSDGTEVKNLTWAGAGNQSTSFDQIRNGSEVVRSKMTITGYASSGNYPKNLLFDFNNNSTTDVSIWGELQGSQIQTYEFNDSSTVTTLDYNDTGVHTFTIRLPKDFNVTSATMNVSGAQNTYPNAQIQPYYYDCDGDDIGPYSPSMAHRDGTDYLYVFGGKCLDNICSGTYNTTFAVDIDGGLCSVTLRADVPYKMGVAGCAVYYNNYIYVIGGWDESTYNTAVYRYYPTTNSWTSRTALANGRAFMQCTGKDDQIYMGGGYDSGGYDKEFWRYNITANTWTQLTDMPDGKEQGWMEVLNDTHLIAFGGTRRGSTATGGKTYEYNIAANSWAEKTASPSIWTTTGANINGQIYMYGGVYSGDEIKSIYRYNQSAGNWNLMDAELQGYMYENDCDEIDNHAMCLGPSGFGYGGKMEAIYHYPSGIGIQVEDSETVSYTDTGDISETLSNIGDIATEINDALAACDEDANGYCYITVWAQNSGSGALIFQNLTIVTDLAQIDTGAANVTCDSTYCDQTLRVQSDQQGIMGISSINNTWHGTHNVTWNISTPGNDTYDPSSVTGITTIYYSKFTRTLPYTWTERIFFTPKSYDIDGVAAFGQSASTPIMNISSQAQDKTFNLTARLNETNTCLNITMSSDNNISHGVNFTTSYYQWNQIATGASQGYWMWANLDNCNASVKAYLQPHIDWKACCDTCVGC